MNKNKNDSNKIKNLIIFVNFVLLVALWLWTLDLKSQFVSEKNMTNGRISEAFDSIGGLKERERSLHSYLGIDYFKENRIIFDKKENIKREPGIIYFR